ncbi:MAG: HAD family phosphatase [Cyclobacteriaceae bacterium]
MLVNFTHIKTIIFDLGGVIIDLDVKASIDQLAMLTGIEGNKILEEYDFFKQFEKGQLTDEEFRKQLQNISQNELSVQQIDNAWNAMLIDIDPRKLQIVKALSSRYQTIVLSNTNNIHVQGFNEILFMKTGERDLNKFFDTVYYSHDLKMRKPDLEIYEYVLNQHELKPEETLFLDDNKVNLDAAQKLGIQTHHIDHPEKVFEIFKAWM